MEFFNGIIGKLTFEKETTNVVNVKVIEYVTLKSKESESYRDLTNFYEEMIASKNGFISYTKIQSKSN